MFKVMKNGVQVGRGVYMAGDLIETLPEGVAIPTVDEQTAKFGGVLVMPVVAAVEPKETPAAIEAAKDTPVKHRGRKKASE